MSLRLIKEMNRLISNEFQTFTYKDAKQQEKDDLITLITNTEKKLIRS